MSENHRYIAVDFDPFGDSKTESFISTTEEQREIFTSIQIGGNAASLAYNESVTLKLKGNCNTDALAKACLALVQRHDALRSVFSSNGEILEILPSVEIPVPVIDLTDLNPEEKQKRLNHFTSREVEIPFDLVNGPVIRFAIFKLGLTETALVITAHHIVCDGWSIGIMMQDVSKFYSAFATNTKPELEEVQSFKEYAQRQQQRKQSGEYAQMENYWLQQYAHDIPTVDMPIDRSRPATRTFTAARHDVLVNETLVTSLKKLGAKNGCSYVNTLFAAFEVFLYRITQQNNLVVGLPAAGQSPAALYNMVGHCVNLLPIRSEVNGDITFSEYIKQRKKSMFDAFDHQEFTMGSLLNKLPLQRDPSRIPLVPVVFNVDLGITNGVNFEGLTYEFVSNPRKYENFEMFVNATGMGDKLMVECTYNTDLFDAAMIEQRMKEFVVLLEGIVEQTDATLKYLPVLTQDEKQKLFIDWCLRKDNPLKAECMHSLFEKEVAAHPNEKAIWFNNADITYDELNQRANRLAHHLKKLGVDKETLVGICHERSTDLIVAMFAVLKAGGAYVPLDPNYPADRIAYILDDAQAPVLITSSAQLKNLGNVTSKVVCLDTDAEKINKESNENPALNSSPENLAYIIYTSGSTGKPKGVAIEHRNAVALIDWARGVYSKEELKGVLASTSVCFDLSIFEIFFTLGSGGRIIVVKDALALSSLPASAIVTLINTVPSAIAELLKLNNGVPKSVKTVNLAGEPLPIELVNKIYETTSADKVYDLYGPSEDTTYSTYTLRKANGPYTIGKALTNSQVYLLDKNLRPVPVGIAGEIYIGGDGLARGYLYKPEMTAERFITNPFDPETRLYKTGDVGKFMPDGNIEFLGRIDNQVKIRGFRIELGEIETALRQRKEIKELVVVAREDNPSDKRLVAYIAPVAGKQININELKQHLRVDLPEFMIPSVFMVMDNLPLTPNGKIDRKALPKPDVTVKIESANFEEPHNAVESMLAGIWSEILGLDRIGIHDNFFELGGHSLLGIRMMGEIERRMGAKLDYPTLFRASTISQLAKIINAEELNVEWPILVPLQPNGNKTPLFFLHMHNGNVQRWRVLLKYLDKDQPVYALQPRGLDEKFDYHYSIEEMATFYINEIKKVQPKGPYRLAGLCFGGTAAVEMAKQLQEKGDQTELLFTINNYAPPANPLQYKIRETWDEFKEMKMEDKLEFALEKTKSAGKKMFSKLTKVFDSGSHETIAEPKAKTKPDIRWVHSIALLNYQPQSMYKGDITLVRTGEEVAKHYDEYLGWKRLIEGNISLSSIAGSDNDSIITDEKYYTQLGGKLNVALHSIDKGKA